MTTETRPGSACGRMWPAGNLVDLVERVDEHELLHVGVRLEYRNRELDLSCRPPVRLAAGQLIALDQEPLLQQTVDQAQQPQLDLNRIAEVPLPGESQQRLTGPAGGQPLPGLRPDAVQAVVGAGAQVDQDRLTVDRLVDDVHRVHMESSSHRPGEAIVARRRGQGGVELTVSGVAGAYLRDHASACDRAMERGGVITLDLRLGTDKVRLRFAGDALVPYAQPLTHQIESSSDATRPVLTIDLWDGESTGVLPPPFPGGEQVPAKGEIRRSDEAGVRLQSTSGVRGSDGAFEAMTIFDERASVIRYFVTMPDRIPWYERAAPLRTALHWGLTRSDCLLVHAGAVGSDGHAVLLAGRGGSGKSTTAVAALLAGHNYLGDDYAFLDLTGPQPAVHSLHTTAKLSPDALALLPELAGHSALRLPDRAEKQVLNVAALRPDAVRRSARIASIVVPDVRRSGPRGLERLSPGAAL